MKVLGIVGGVAAGKSHVASAFTSLGAQVIDADLIGHAVLKDPEVKKQLVQRLGESILDPQGEIVRPAVGALVFGSSSEAKQNRQFLESLSHPRIRSQIQHQLETLRMQNCPLVILDAALLIETGLAKLCDAVLFVEVPEATRLKRAITRGWTKEQWQTREANQLPLAEKRAAAKFVIQNDGNEPLLHNQAKQVWETLVR
ncbi:MAG: dephospho-CoA kinase [Planctomycetaceae bacterium]